MLDELLYLLGIYDNNIVDSTQKFAYESSDSESCFLFNLFVEYKLLVLGIMFLFLLFTNWLVRLNKTNLEGKKNADIAHCSKASVCSITHLTNDDAKKIYSCIKVQDKVFKKLIFNEMKLKFLENLMFSFWNKTHQKRSSEMRRFSSTNYWKSPEFGSSSSD
uniref:Testis-expressed protein 46 isoform X2 n=1 Tax=Geotrypetes seraphini TaxID=260995 RepID=A0A6P8RY80_GEOSA|nr:testis-expressed protein 46 isoform X2 [Geotrypetes seraphini]